MYSSMIFDTVVMFASYAGVLIYMLVLIACEAGVTDDTS